MLNGEEIEEDGGAQYSGDGDAEAEEDTAVVEIEGDREIEGMHTYVETCNQSLIPLTDTNDKFSAVVEYILLQLNNDPVYLKFSKSPSIPVCASACIDKYLQVAGFVDKFLGAKTLQDLELASEVVVTKVCFCQQSCVDANF